MGTSPVRFLPRILTVYVIAFRGFKALKQSTKLLYLTLRRPNDALKTYQELLTYTKSAVTRNYSEKTINGILDYVGGGKGGPVEVDVLEEFYEATKKALEDARNEVCTVIVACGMPLISIRRGCQRRRTSSWLSFGSTAMNMVGYRRHADLNKYSSTLLTLG